MHLSAEPGKYGAELAVKEINEAGGIAGKQVELNYQDSQGDSESAVNAYGPPLAEGSLPQAAMARTMRTAIIILKSFFILFYSFTFY